MSVATGNPAKDWTFFRHMLNSRDVVMRYAGNGQMIRLFVLLNLLFLAACAPVALTDRITVDAFEYRIGSGDKLKVTTYGEERLSGDFTVNSAGAIAFPLVGDVMAKGKTLSEFSAQLRTTLGSEYVRNPQVSVEIVNFRPVYVLGEVAKPGEFAYNERMSVFALVAKAGGYTYRANQDFAYIRGEGDSDERAVRLGSATAVQPGDTIRIPERRF